MKDLKEKYIWLVGASSGIGAALAKELAERGAIVALSARREDALEKLQSEMQGEGHIVVPADAAADDSIKTAFETITDIFPRIDSVIYMAAIFTPHDGNDKSLSVIKDMINVNLTGAFRVIDVTKPYLQSRGGGQIVLCASVAGFRGLPTGQPYCATKAALINLAESLYVDLAPHNIDVKVINPGFVRTPLTDKNTFKMPMMVEPDDAARSIARGLTSKSFEIAFPKTFIVMMKILNILPNAVYFWLAKKMI